MILKILLVRINPGRYPAFLYGVFGVAVLGCILAIVGGCSAQAGDPGEPCACFVPREREERERERERGRERGGERGEGGE